MVVNTQTLKDNPNLGKALIGIWYETIALMKDTSPTKARPRARPWPRRRARISRASKPSSRPPTCFTRHRTRVTFIQAGRICSKIMDLVRTFCFDHDLLGDGREIEGRCRHRCPDGKVLGSTKNVKLRFDSTYMQMAADGKLLARRLRAPEERTASEVPCGASMNIVAARGAGRDASLASAAVPADRDGLCASPRLPGMPPIPTTSCCRRSSEMTATIGSAWPSSRTGAPATTCCGPIPAASLERLALGTRHCDPRSG